MNKDNFITESGFKFKLLTNSVLFELIKKYFIITFYINKYGIDFTRNLINGAYWYDNITMYINFLGIKISSKLAYKIDFIPCLVNTISHESIHMVLNKIEGQYASSCYDKIDIPLRKKGYLGFSCKHYAPSVDEFRMEYLKLKKKYKRDNNEYT